MSMYQRDLAAFHDAYAGAIARGAAGTFISALHAAGFRGGWVADLGCGGGQAAERLVDAGFDVLGVDPSPAMLELAANRVPRAKLLQQTVAEADLPGDLVGILAVGEVLGYDLQIDLDEVLERFHDCLRPGGLLLVDVPGPDRHGPTTDTVRVWEEDRALLVMRTRQRRMRLSREITLFTRGRGGHYRRHDEVHELRCYPAQDVRAGLARAGFVAVRPVNAYEKTNVALGDHWPAFIAARP